MLESAQSYLWCFRAKTSYRRITFSSVEFRDGTDGAIVTFLATIYSLSILEP
jgi:hypothetical protein